MTLSNALNRAQHFSRRPIALACLATCAALASCAPGDGELVDNAVGEVVAVQALPGRIQAEDYLVGGEGVGYHDTTTGNSGHAYRTDNVDIEATTDTGGGYDVGWIAPGEWLEFNTTVTTAGWYTFSARVAAADDAAHAFHIEVDGHDVTGAMTLTGDTSYQTFRNVVSAQVELAAGAHTVRFVADSSHFNVNYVDVALVRALCTVSSLLVPSCGAWWGADPGTASLSAFEASIGRQLDIVHSYHADGQAFPTSAEAADDAAGRILLLNWKPSSATNGWHIAAGGSIDTEIAAEADRLVAFGHPLFLALYHEPENNLAGGSDTLAGTAADYVAMWHHVRAIFDAHHVTNVVWVWDMMGFSGHAAHYQSGDLYPGDSYVDWIAFDPYSHSASASSFAEMLNSGHSASWPGFYDWAVATHPGKPLMLAEYGVDDAAATTAQRQQWFIDGANSLPATFPALRALVYFNLYNWTMSSTDGLQAGFTTAGHDAYVNQSH